MIKFRLGKKWNEWALRLNFPESLNMPFQLKKKKKQTTFFVCEDKSSRPETFLSTEQPALCLLEVLAIQEN